MSYVPMTPSPVRSRPGVVTVASILLYIVGALFVVRGFVAVAAVPTDSTGAQVGGLVEMLVLAATGAGFATLGAFVARGKNGARVTTWVVGGLFSACCGFDALVSAADGSSTYYTETTGTESTTYEAPGWSVVANGVLSVLIVLALVTVIILLAIPDSSAYFRPPAPVAAWPGYPALGYPAPAPGYPTPGYPTQGYPTPGYPTSGYPTLGYPTPGYPTQGYPMPGAPMPGSPTPGAPMPGAPTPGSPTPGDSTSGYSTPSYPTSGDPTSGYSTPSYAAPVYTAPEPWAASPTPGQVSTPPAPRPPTPEPPAEGEPPR